MQTQLQIAAQNFVNAQQHVDDEHYEQNANTVVLALTKAKLSVYSVKFTKLRSDFDYYVAQLA